MAWTKEIGPDGLPRWRGKDTIYNYANSFNPAMITAGAIMVAFPLFMGAFAGGGSVGKFLAGFLSLIMIPCGAAFLLHSFLVRQKFIGDEWQLVASPDGLQLQLKGAARMRERWAVPLGAVGRVEVARSAEYTPAREYPRGLMGGGGFQNTPAHEWQTFLFLNDGTRRVIYHANAARDDCAALAASIREYVESARAGAAPSSPSPPDAAGGSGPRAAGFDL